MGTNCAKIAALESPEKPDLADAKPLGLKFDQALAYQGATAIRIRFVRVHVPRDIGESLVTNDRPHRRSHREVVRMLQAQGEKNDSRVNVLDCPR